MAAVDERVKQIIVEQLGVDEAEVTPNASFVDDLGADSLDTVELVMAFEEAFEIEIPDEDAEEDPHRAGRDHVHRPARQGEKVAHHPIARTHPRHSPCGPGPGATVSCPPPAGRKETADLWHPLTNA